MKKFYYLIAMAVMAFTFTSCEDVPEPYGQPTNPNSTTSVDPAGTGTADDPFNVAGAIAKCKEIGNTVSSEKYYIKGYAASAATADAQYGNVSFDMTDSQDGKGKKFKAYQVAGSDGQKLAEGYTINVGDEVVIYGPIYNYNNSTPETAGKAAAYIVTVNGEKTNGGGGGGEVGEGTGTGTETDPYDVTAAIAAGDKTGVYVKAYIVGFISGKTIADGATFSAEGAVATNVMIAASADETNTANCMPVQLPTGAVRTGLNLADNAGNLKKEVLLYGDLAKYFGQAGVKNVTYAVINGTEIGTKPGAGGTTGGGNDILNVSFASGQGDFTIDNKEIGSLTFVWKADSKGYMKASAYVNNANNAAESWLVSPAFSLKNTTAPVLTFNNACNFIKEGTITDHIKVMVFDGTNWAEATMTNLPDGKSWTFVDTTVDLKAYAGKENVKVAFKYVSTTAVAHTWEIKTVTIK